MNDQEPWEEEKVKNPWLIKTEEDKKIVQREGKLIKEEESDFCPLPCWGKRQKIIEVIIIGLLFIGLIWLFF